MRNKRARQIKKMSNSVMEYRKNKRKYSMKNKFEKVKFLSKLKLKNDEKGE